LSCTAETSGWSAQGKGARKWAWSRARRVGRAGAHRRRRGRSGGRRPVRKQARVSGG